MFQHSMLKKLAVAPVLLLLPLAGCDNNKATTQTYEPNYLYAAAIGIAEDTPLDQPLADSQDLLTEWFGTLDQPKLPEFLNEGEYKELMSLSNLEVAAGPPPATPEPGEKGLYRQLCASCHGESGQGRGPTAASQNPYPREFRLGLFKYKSTPRKYKPSKADIAKVLRKGLAGTQMPVFHKLSDKQIDALVDYVVFLSIRGEFERKLIYNAAYELDLEKERVYNVALKSATDGESKKAFDGQVESAKEILTEIADLWVESADSVEEFELPDFPIVGSETDATRPALEESIAKGKLLFQSEAAACSKCHGVSAKGDGPQLPDYDDWTKDWTSKIGLKPTDTEAIVQLMAKGGLKPQPLMPRNLVEGKFRSGRDPMDLYRRIRYGIVGSPMPAASVVSSPEEKGLQEADLWHLVNYVLSIAEPEQPIVEAPIKTAAL